MLRLTLIIFVCLAIKFSAFCQLADGSDVPNFTLDDLDGVTHDLHDYLNQGYGAILDFSATWCPPCWSYHQGGTLEDVWHDFGPDGTDETMVFFIEPDPTTTEPCIYGSSGCSGGSLGNWTTGVEYPILNPPSSGASQVNNAFNINYFPTLYAVGPNYKIYETGQISYNSWATWVESFKLAADYTVSGDGCDGTKEIELNVTGGFNNISYNWSNGESSQNLDSATAGTYYVTLTDAHGYDIEVGPITVETNPEFTIALDVLDDISCFGEQDGIIAINTIGGTGAFSYAWSNGSNNDDISNLSEGNYTVTVSDNGSGCTSVSSYLVMEPEEIEFDTDVVDTDCFEENGSISVFAEGGTLPYTYTLSGFSTSNPVFANVNPGNYLLVVSDANDCSIEEYISISSPSVPEVDTISPALLTCSNTIIEMNADSSSIGNNIEYYWFLDDMPVDTGYQAQFDTIGSYSLLVTNLSTTCTAELQFEIEQNIEEPAIAITTSEDIITCSTPEISLNAVNENESIGLVYEWSNLQNEDNYGDSTSIIVNEASEYLLMGTDTLNGCISTDTVLILLDIETPEVVLLEVIDIDCTQTEGSIAIDLNENSSVTWSTSDGIIINTIGDDVIVGSDGNYIGEVTSSVNGCSTQVSYEVLASTELPEIEFDTPEVLTCANTTASLVANESDNYSYTWFDTNDEEILDANSNSILVDAPGTYVLEVLDNTNSCTKTQSITAEGNYETPTIISENIEPITCSNPLGTISVDASPEYAFSWTSLDTNDVLDQSSLSLDVSQSGNYELVLIDPTNGCQSNYTYEVEAFLDVPEFAIDGVTILDCNRSETTLVSLANENYTYAWSNGLGEVFANTAEVNVSVAGVYILEATDNSNGCTSTKQIEVVENFDAPVIELISKDEVDCTGELAEIVLANNEDYTYQWSTLDGTIEENENNVIRVSKSGTYEVKVTNTINGCSNTEFYDIFYSVPPPTLTISGTLEFCEGSTTSICADTNGETLTWIIDGQMVSSNTCFDVGTNSIVEVIAENSLGCTSNESVIVSQFDYPSLSVDNNGILDCNTESVMLSANYELDQMDRTFEWIDVDGNTLGENPILEVSVSGVYILQVSYPTVGCIDNRMIEVERDDTVLPTSQFSSEATQLEVSFTQEVIDPFDNITWDFGDGETSLDNNPTHTYTQAAYYTVCMTVSNKCGENTSCEEVLAASAISYNVSTEHNDCYGDSLGAFELSLNGGLPEYNVEWTGPNGFLSNEVNISNLEAGEYQVSIQDQGIEDITQTFTINQPEELTINADIQDETVGLANGSIVLDVDGGVGNIDYSWDNGATESTISELVAGDYTVEIMDANGCIKTETYTILGIVSSNNEILNLNHFELHPNPANSLIHLNIELLEATQAEIVIYDMHGKAIQKFNFTDKVFNKTLVLDAFEDGIYFVGIQTTSGATTKKFVVIR